MKMTFAGRPIEPHISKDPKTGELRLLVDGKQFDRGKHDMKIIWKMAELYRQESERFKFEAKRHAENYGGACSTIGILDQKLTVSRLVIEALLALASDVSYELDNEAELKRAILDVLNSQERAKHGQ